ncbi:MAG: hypothetical protein ACK54C_06025 [Betaproteobacteria bacterium]
MLRWNVDVQRYSPITYGEDRLYCTPADVPVTGSVVRVRVTDPFESRVHRSFDFGISPEAAAALPGCLERAFAVASAARDLLAGRPALGDRQLGPYPASLAVDALG